MDKSFCQLRCLISQDLGSGQAKGWLKQHVGSVAFGSGGFCLCSHLKGFLIEKGSKITQYEKVTGKLPGGPVARTWQFHCHGSGSIPDWGSRFPQATPLPSPPRPIPAKSYNDKKAKKKKRNFMYYFCNKKILKTYVHMQTCTWMFTAAIFATAKKWK